MTYNVFSWDVKPYSFSQSCSTRLKLLVTMTPCVCDMTKTERLSKQKNAIDTLRRLVSTTECGCAVDGTVDTVDDQGNTVVHYAAQLGCCRTLLAVLPHSSPVVSVPNKFGITPLHVAADRGINDEVQVSICYFCACISAQYTLSLVLPSNK